MTAQQFLERRFIALIAKAVEQLAVTETSQFALPVKAMNFPQDGLKLCRRHNVTVRGKWSSVVNCRHGNGASAIYPAF